MILKPMPYAEYSKLDGVNWTTAKELGVSPKHYRHLLANPRSETEALRVGLGVHSFVLEPETWPTKYVTYREPKNKGEGSKTRWSAFQVEHADRVILDIDEHDRVVGAGSAVLAHPLASKYFGDGYAEQVLTWTDAPTGIACRGRIDHYDGFQVELKTAAQLDPRLFAAQAARLMYPEQCAFYRRGLRANGITTDDTPIMVVVESVQPHDVVVFRVPGDVMLAADEKVSTLLALLKRCRDEDHWPGRFEEETDLLMPRWSLPFDDGLGFVLGDAPEVAL